MTRYLLPLILLAALSAPASAQAPVVPCPGGACPSAIRPFVPYSIPRAAPVPAYRGVYRLAIRERVGERRPVRRLLGVPTRFILRGVCR